MKEYARQFYSSKAWQRTRTAYTKARRGLCEVCLSKGIVKPGEIVHHKIHLDPKNINNPSITLDWNNLQLVCRDCHAAIHELNQRKRRYKIDECGRVIVRE